MLNKFSRITEFVDTLEVFELSDEEQAVLFVGLYGGSGGSSNNCQCEANNCQCTANNCQCGGGNNCQCHGNNCQC